MVLSTRPQRMFLPPNGTNATRRVAQIFFRQRQLVHMARLSPPGRRTTLILLTPDGDGVWYGPGAPLGLRLTFGCRD